jgi:hypothetical protein
MTKQLITTLLAIVLSGAASVQSASGQSAAAPSASAQPASAQSAAAQSASARPASVPSASAQSAAAQTPGDTSLTGPYQLTVDLSGIPGVSGKLYLNYYDVAAKNWFADSLDIKGSRPLVFKGSLSEPVLARLRLVPQGVTPATGMLLVSDFQFWDNAVAKLYGVQAVPQNILIDPQGKIIAKNLRGAKLEQKLEEIIPKNVN